MSKRGNPNHIKGQPQPAYLVKQVGAKMKSRFPFRSTRDILADRSKNPTEELLDLIPHLDLKEQMHAWMFLITYSQCKPAIDGAQSLDGSESLAKRVESLTDEQLVEAIVSARAENARLIK